LEEEFFTGKISWEILGDVVRDCLVWDMFMGKFWGLIFHGECLGELSRVLVCKVKGKVNVDLYSASSQTHL